MSFDATVLQVVLASPSDTAEARESVTRALADWNAVNAASMRVVLLPVGWESHGTPSMAGRAQEVLDGQLLPQSDVLIGLFWTRLGTPTGAAPSGTVAEIERFIAQGKRTLIYLSSMPVVPGNIDTRQFQDLQDFRSDLQSRGLLGSYDSHEDLYRQVHRDLTRVVRELADAGRVGQPSAGNPQFTLVRSDPDLLTTFRLELQQLREELRLYWRPASQSSFPDVAEWKGMLTVFHERLRSYSAQVSVVLGSRVPLLVEDLETLGNMAYAAASTRFMIDGGASLRRFEGIVNALLAGLEHVDSEPWTTYPERRVDAARHDSLEGE